MESCSIPRLQVGEIAAYRVVDLSEHHGQVPNRFVDPKGATMWQHQALRLDPDRIVLREFCIASESYWLGIPSAMARTTASFIPSCHEFYT
jgi:hypothetical protein